jgi:hypothetical protein
MARVRLGWCEDAVTVDALRRRWLVAIALSIAVPLTLVSGFGHRGVHAARNLLVPGAGLYDHHLAIGLCLTLAFLVTTVAWFRWGADWCVAAVVIGACISSALLTSSSDAARTTIARSAHEFPLVILVLGALSWFKLAAARLGRVRARSRASGGLAALATLRPVDRCQAVTIACLAGLTEPGDPLLSAIDADDVRRRARRVGCLARLRVGGDPFRFDHAHARTAILLAGRLGDPARAELAVDARRCLLGVPCSEPGWVRLLDGTLAAAALRRFGDEAAGDRWQQSLRTRFGLRRAHRPAAVWTPLGIPMTSAAPWEHAAALAIAHAAGWCGDEDWALLRRSALGAAARGADRPADERLVAAARVWVALVDDKPAQRIVSRPTIGRDPLAAALDALATRLRHDARWLCSTAEPRGPGRSPPPTTYSSRPSD